jgi:hypothetical protein
MDDDDRTPKKYTLVRAADGNYYAVAKDVATPIENLGNADQQELIHERVRELETAQYNLDVALRGPLGSGVRVRVPDILD